MSNVLVTGGAGFIGSNFINYCAKKYPHYRIINLDLLTEAADLSNIAVHDSQNYHFIKGDICDAGLVHKVFSDYSINGVIHFAAESHVDNSIKDPEKFVRTNVLGTSVLLSAARTMWMESPFKCKKEHFSSRFYHISTDEVYGTLGDEGCFTEASPYAPNSPYSASKASSDMLVRSYFHTYGLNTVISNCSNNYGANQHDEKLIPTIIRSALLGLDIPIYGNGKNIRDWLYVSDHCKAIDILYHKADNGDTYLIGGGCEKTNIDLAIMICQILDQLYPKTAGSYKDQIKFVQDRPGHDFRYAVDAAKIRMKFGWEASKDFESCIMETIKFYLAKYISVEEVA